MNALTSVRSPGVLVLVSLIAFAPFVSGQVGQVYFANRVLGQVDAPVISALSLNGPGPEYAAQLFLVEPNSSVKPLVPATVFNSPGTGANFIADRYWVPQTIDLPGVAPGTSATFVVRAWRTSYGSYEGAILDGWGNGFYGQSEPFTITVGGGLMPPANLIGLKPFMVDPFPEPSTMALGLSGGAVILAWHTARRRAAL